MFNSEVVDRRLQKLQKKLSFPLKPYPVGDSIDRQLHLIHLWDREKGQIRRPLTRDEQEFVINEQILCTYDFNYFAPRYAFINTKTGERKRIEFWESQRIALEHISRGELDAWKTGRDNLWDWLKARQLGATAVCEIIIGHRIFFFENQRAVIASDEPNHSLELSRRVELLYDMLPWYMKPSRKFHVKGTEMFFDDLNSSLIVGHGRKEGGGLAQGQTTNVYHLTEIPDWENWEQIEEDFTPTVPLHPTSTGFRESTARGRDNSWHQMFKASWAGKSRHRAMFIPWYAEENTYRMIAPDDWRPLKVTEDHAAKVERQSPLYCLGRTVRLSREQMYWWERTYLEYKEKGRLHIALQEFCSDHLEAFQHGGVSIFDNDFLLEMRQQCKPFKAYTLLSA